MIITSVFYVFIAIWDIEEDKTYNYLLQTPRNSQRQYSIAYSDKDKLPFKDGEVFKIRATVECEDVYALDKAPPIFERAFPDGVPRKQWICNSQKMEVLND